MFPQTFFPRILDGANFNSNTLQDYQRRLEELSTTVFPESQEKNTLHQLSEDLSQAPHTAAANGVIDKINSWLAGQSSPLTFLLNLPPEIHVEILAKLRHLVPIHPFATINRQFYKVTSHLQKKIYEEVVQLLYAEIEHDHAVYEALIQATESFVELPYSQQADEHDYQKAWKSITLFFSTQDPLIQQSHFLSKTKVLCDDGYYANDSSIFDHIRHARLKCRSLLNLNENLVKLNDAIKNALHCFFTSDPANREACRSKLDLLLFNLFLTSRLYKNKEEINPLLAQVPGFTLLLQLAKGWSSGFIRYDKFEKEIKLILSRQNGAQIFALISFSILFEDGRGIPLELYKIEKFKLSSKPTPGVIMRRCTDPFIFHLKRVFNQLKEPDRKLMTEAILRSPLTLHSISQDERHFDSLFVINFITQLSRLKKHEKILLFAKNHQNNPLCFLIILDTLYGCDDLATIEQIFAQFKNNLALQHPQVGLIKDLLTSSITLKDLPIQIVPNFDTKYHWFIPNSLTSQQITMLVCENQISSFFYYFLAKFILKNASLDHLIEFVKKHHLSDYILEHLIQKVDELDLILKIYPFTNKRKNSIKIFTRLLLEKIGTDDPTLKEFLLRNLDNPCLKKNPLNLNHDQQRSINFKLAWACYAKREDYFKKTVQEIEEALQLHQNLLIEPFLWDELKKHQTLPFSQPINLLYAHPKPSAFCYLSAAPRVEQIGMIFKYYSSFKSPTNALYYEHLSKYFPFAEGTLEEFTTLWKRFAKVTSLRKPPFFHQFLIRYAYQQLIQNPVQNSQQLLTLFKTALKLSKQFLEEIQVYLDVFSPNFESSLQSLSLEGSSPYDHLILEHPHYTPALLVQNLDLVARIVPCNPNPHYQLGIMQALIDYPYPSSIQLLKGCELLLQLWKSSSEKKTIPREQITQLCGRLVQSFENSAAEQVSFSCLTQMEDAVKNIRESLVLD